MLPRTDDLLDDLLTVAVATRPERLALTGDPPLDFRALAQCSTRLARLLAGFGVGRGSRVGMAVPRSTASVVASFSILETGAAFVPLPVGTPPARVAAIARDCGMQMLITGHSQAREFSSHLGEESPIQTVLALRDVRHPDDTAERVWSREGAVGQQPSHTLPGSRTSEDPAYILYTSGSTGGPKGVMISHRAALSFVRWCVEAFELCADDRVAHLSALSFDLSIFEVFAAVASGAAIVPVAEAVPLFPRSLADTLAREAVSVLYTVPSQLVRLVQSGELSRYDFGSLRALLFAGEVLPVKYLTELHRSFPRATLHNLFGPTETNVCTLHTVVDPSRTRTEPLPIGRACAGFSLYVLADDGRLAAPGEEGELLAAGPGLMSGYCNIEQEGGSALRPDPALRGLHDGPLYRTGDRVRLASDGEYRFLGRRDQMVKVRGYRVELGELEHQLLAHPAVASAVAVDYPDGDRLGAIVVLAAECDPDEILRHCRRHLPAYMVPAHLQVVDSLPTTTSGKLDRLAMRRLLGAEK